MPKVHRIESARGLSTRGIRNNKTDNFSSLLGEKIVNMESLASLYDHGDDILHMCKKYDVSRPTVHEAMRDAETLDSILKSRSLSLVFQCRLVTAVANHPCFVPENPLNAEVQVNSLLPYLSSSCCWVRSLACSLTRVFASGLDKNGEHFETQGKEGSMLEKFLFEQSIDERGGAPKSSQYSLGWLGKVGDRV